MLLSDVKRFARKQLREAKEFAKTIKLAEASRRKSLTANRAEQIIAEASIADDSEFASLAIGDGVGAWASIAAVDLRGSTRLADELTPRQTYLMVHTLLPTLAYVCEHSSGSVMNFRGDGLFAAFGLEKLYVHSSEEPDEEHIEDANMNAVVCGLRLIEATRDAVSPVLNEEEGLDLDLSVGVGVDCGHIVVTRIGWTTAAELTGYGSAVNHACKLSTCRNKVSLSNEVKSEYPSGETGMMQIRWSEGGYIASHPKPQLQR